ncbi:MAG: elongation factor G [Marinilabiliales bacterium]|nr:MAG: elongation factor G [Marinilabiliales bacterium]
MKAYVFEDGVRRETEIPEEYMESATEWRTNLLEKLADFSDEIAELFLSDEEISEELIVRSTRECILRLLITPVYCGAAYQNVGIQPLLDAVVNFMPNPIDKGKADGVDLQDQEVIHSRYPSVNEPFAGLAFKIINDPYVGQQTFIRIYSGVLNTGDTVYNATTRKKERVSRIMKIKAKDRIEINSAGSGDIVALVGLKNTWTGHTLCDIEKPLLLETVRVPEPVISVKVNTKSRKDLGKLHSSLRKVSLEDPSFTVRTIERTAETVIAGMGELHLEIIVDRLLTEFGVETEVSKPSVEYKETITQEVTHELKYVKQSGGKGQYAHMILRIEPNASGKFEFESRITGGAIPSEYIPAIQKGIKETLNDGVLADFQVVNIKAVLLDGSFHDVDSSEMAFKICASKCFKESFRKASPILLEPIMKVDIATPDEYIGDITGDFNRRRGRIEGIRRFRKGSQKINGEAPLMELFGYATAVRTLSSGRANYSMEMHNYQPMPAKQQEEVLKEAAERLKD